MTVQVTQNEVLAAFLDAVAKGDGVALITVTKNETSGEPPLGAKMAVWEDGKRLGSLGNPDMEEDIAQDALESIKNQKSLSVVYPRTTSRTLRTRRTSPFEVYIEVVQPPTLLVVGAGHIGGFVARLGKMVGFDVVVLDDRPEFANEERLPDADQVIAQDFAEALTEFPIDENTYIVIVTRGHKQDELSLRHVINSSAAYVGMIGSHRRASAVLKMVYDSGVPLESIAQVRSPIGLDIGAETPEEIAVSIISEILMAYKGGTGMPMSKKDPITQRVATQ
ncbi:MAG: xanthine dehydrogenase [Dehalococcoidia bacterium]|nr:xanthine dehydrogenase [Dehalococcoidia bacterium]